jgi:hypothetical protein
MGTKGREIVGMDVEQLLKLLNMAFGRVVGLLSILDRRQVGEGTDERSRDR